MKTRFLRCLLLSLASLLLSLGPSFAQISNVTDVEATPIPGAGHNYIGVLNETVNPANGSLSLRINVPVPKGRGLTLPFSIAYDSNGAVPTAISVGAFPPFFQLGWSLSVPMLTSQVFTYHRNEEACTIHTGYVFYDANGNRHSLNSPVGNNQFGLVLAPGQCPDFSYDTYNTGGDPLVVATDFGTIQDADGTTYTFGSGSSSVEDRNGNLVQYAYSGSALTVTDTAGRPMINANGFGGTGSNTLAVSGLGSSYGLNWGTTTWNYQNGLNLVWNPEPSDPCSPGIVSHPQSPSSTAVLTSIQLPNGQSYQFHYNSTYGLLTEIDYPTGGKVVYTWGINTTAPNQMDIGSGTLTDGSPFYCNYLYSSPVITERDVYYNSGSLAEVQTFTYHSNWGASGTSQAGVWSTKTATVTTTDKLRTINNSHPSFTTSYTYTPVLIPTPPYSPTAFGAQVPVESQAVYNNYDGTLLRTVNKQWKNQYLLTSEQTVLPNGTQNGLASQVKYSYGPLGVVTEKDEYDYGQTAVTRSTVTNYQLFGPNALNSVIYDRPCQTIVYNGSPSSGSRAAETDYYYDGGTGTCTAGTPVVSTAGGATLTGHDETYYGVSSPATPRGNLTKVVNQCFPVTTTSCTAGNPTTSYTYDETGQPTTMTDPNSNLTKYSFADNYQSTNTGTYTSTAGSPPSGMVTNAFLTEITYPKIGNINHIENFTYGYNDGELTTASDQSSQTIIYRYNDNLDRPTETDYPDQGQTTVRYSDVPPSPSVTTTKLITSSLSAATTAVMDGLGHVVQTQLTSDPDGATYTANSYDGLGMTYQTWNPTRCVPPATCPSETTWGITTNTYDDLGRITQVAEPDGSMTSTSYSANTTGFLTTVTDEVGNQRTSQTDGLGRLTKVWEAPNVSGYNYETDYTYDFLNNLLSVTQKGGSGSSQWRQRSFVYDSLSHVTSVTNPESGMIAYIYDANGNVATKTAPSPNQGPTGIASVTTSYTYDALNRLIGKSYNDSYPANSPTPGVSYAYDGTNLTGCNPAPPGLTDSYPIPRRTSMCDGSGATSWAHDKMGRVLKERRTIGTISGDYENDTFNLDGSVASVTSLGYTIAYTYGGAARPLTAMNSTKKIVTAATYAPPGELAGATLGTHGITVSNAYNDRLQPLLLSAGVTGQNPIFSECFDYHLGVAVIGPSPCSFMKYGTGADNGNVYQIVNNRDSTRSQNFIYDPLNRIQQAYSSGSQWGETFGPTATAPGVPPTTSGIDPWGNLTQRSAVTGKSSYELLSVSAGTNNQLSGFGYDPAGNMTSSAPASYVYDDENRLIATAGYSYLYDGDGERVEKCTEGTPGTCAAGATGTLYWRGLGSAPLAETDLSGNVQNNYIFFGGQRVARNDSLGVIHYYFSDHLGSHGVVENATGTACEQDIDYYPYGGVEYDYVNQCGAQVPQNYKFTGKERDSESGLDMFGARYYGSSLGRFMTPDWAAKPVTVPYAHFGNPQSLNLYSYVQNNPTTVGDPDGHGDQTGPTYSCSGGTCQQIPEPPMSETEKQIDKGILELSAAAIAGPEVLAAAGEATTILQGLGVGTAALGTTGTAVNGTVDIVGGLTHTNVDAGTNAVTAVTNPVAGAASLATGSMEKGSQVADLTTVVKAGVNLATGKGMSNPAEVGSSLAGARDAVTGAVATVKSVISGPPAPPAPPTPKPPSCASSGSCN